MSKDKMTGTLVVIPARGGSKGLPGKNIKPLNGKPLIYYTIDAAREVVDDSDICVTTDDEYIVSTVEKYGIKVPFLRPSKLASDNAGSYEVLLHALKFYQDKGIRYERIILLQPTSPFRTGHQIKEANKLWNFDLDMVVSVKETKSNPYFLLFEENKHGFLEKSKSGNFLRRQDCPKVWEYNGAIYIINVKSLQKFKLNEFTKVVKYEMDNFSSLDIDDMMDFLMAETLVKMKTKLELG